MGLRGIDLFCGAGGSSWGAAAAGIEMVGAVDLWPMATATYADNFAKARKNVITATLSDQTGAEIFSGIGKVDLLIASPECTHHSLARGNRPKCDSSRRSGWFVTRFIEDLAPEFIVLENVAMMRHWDGYRDLLRSLEVRYGYNLRAQVLDAADFGVPQNRKRLFIFGSRKRRPSEIMPTVARQPAARTILDGHDAWEAGVLDNGRRAEATLARVQHGIDAVGRGVDFLTVYYGSDKAGGFQTLDRPLRTLTTLDRFGLIGWRKGEPTLRMLQVPELKRAMGLGADFKLGFGTRRDQVRLLGNGVCPAVMQAVIEQLTGRTARAAAPTKAPRSRTTKFAYA
jgi:DNA (cytosine-5)-methyltransferase 1